MTRASLPPREPLISCLQVALGFVEKYGVNKVRLLEFVHNRGKGGAVRMVTFCSKMCMYMPTYTCIADPMYIQSASIKVM